MAREGEFPGQRLRAAQGCSYGDERNAGQNVGQLYRFPRRPVCDGVCCKSHGVHHRPRDGQPRAALQPAERGAAAEVERLGDDEGGGREEGGRSPSAARMRLDAFDDAISRLRCTFSAPMRMNVLVLPHKIPIVIHRRRSGYCSMPEIVVSKCRTPLPN